MLQKLTDIPADQLQPMDERDSVGAMVAAFAEKVNPEFLTADKLPEKLAMLLDTGLAQSHFLDVMIKRLQVADGDLEYSPLLLAFLALISPNVASAVMWAYTVFRETAEDGKFGLLQYKQKFGEKVPSDDALMACWDAQKVHPEIKSIFGWDSDNELDAPEAWKVNENV